MDMLGIAQQLMGATSQNPTLLGQFLDHPYSTTQQVTGASQQLDKTDMSQVLTALAAMTGGQQKPEQLDSNSIANLASQLLGQSNNSVHGLTNMLFGTSQQAAQVQQQAAKKESGGLNLGMLMAVAGIAGTLLSANKKKKQQGGGLDLSDGFGLDDVMALAGGALGGGNQKPTSGVNLNDGVDLGDVAALFGGLLGGK